MYNVLSNPVWISNQESLYNGNAHPAQAPQDTKNLRNPQNFHLFPQTSHRQNATISTHALYTNKGVLKEGVSVGRILVIGSSALLVCI